MALSIPSFLSAWNHLSPLKYAIANMAPYTLRGQTFTCTDWQRLPNGRCPLETGTQVLQLYKLDGDAAMNVMGLGICVVVYRFVAWVVLKMVKERWIGRLGRKLGGKQRVKREKTRDQLESGAGSVREGA